MKNIKVVNKIISLDLIYEDLFTSLNKYECDGNPQYFIKSRVGDINLKGGVIVNKTEYYDIVDYKGTTIQIQKSGDMYIGAIVYNKNTIELIMFGSDFELEYLLSQYAFLYILSDIKNTMFIHGSSICYNKSGILISAKSGTGKSTHRALWEKYGNATCINDDKNVIVYENNSLMLYPNPWSGKHHIDSNIKAPLKAIVFLYQNKTNVVSKLAPKEALKLILGQISMPSCGNVVDWNQMVDRILTLPIYLYGCNMDKSAFLTLESRLGEDGIWE
ncbi:MAG: hypothetical protein ACI35W_01165 [Anaeroplasmataceae bacterium]